MMNNTFFKERMIFCHQWIFAQYTAGLVNDQSHKSCSNTKIKKVHRHMIRDQACQIPSGKNPASDQTAKLQT